MMGGPDVEYFEVVDDAPDSEARARLLAATLRLVSAAAWRMGLTFG